MDLPSALKPWALYLNLFPLRVRDRLGELVPRLDRLLGPLESVGAAELGEPEGYEGIERRGSYERLLMSEWLLADEMPEEFLRRASSGEHAFIQLAQIKPASNRTVLAVFDAGPSQLGMPRVAQIALLIVLARRADAGGAKFEWGVLQDPQSDVTSGVTEATVSRFIRRRYAFEANAEHLSYWWDRIGSDSTGSWLVGGARALRQNHSLTLPRIQIDPQYDGLIDRLSISVFQPGKQTTSATLQAPDVPVCLRLFRSLSTGKQASPTVTNRKIISNICFSATKRYLFGRVADDTVVVHNVPATGAKLAAKPKVYATSGQRLIVAAAIGRNKRAAILVSLHKNSPTLSVESIGGRLQYTKADVALPDELLQDCASIREGNHPLQHCAVYLDGLSQKLYTIINDKLLALPVNAETARAEILQRDVVAFNPFGQRLIYAVKNETGVLVNSWKPGELDGRSGKPAAPVTRQIEGFPQQLFVGFGRCWKSAPGYIVYRLDNGDWKVMFDKIEHRYEVGAATVLGACGLKTQECPSLLVLDQDRTTLVAIGKEGREYAPPADAEITHVAVSSDGDVAYLTARGDLTVYSFSDRSTVHRVLQEDA